MSESGESRRLEAIQNLQNPELSITRNNILVRNHQTARLKQHIQRREEWGGSRWAEIAARREEQVCQALVGTYLCVGGHFITEDVPCELVPTAKWWEIKRYWLRATEFEMFDTQEVTVIDVKEVDAEFETQAFGNVFAILVDDAEGNRQVGHLNYDPSQAIFPDVYKGLTIRMRHSIVGSEAHTNGP